MAGRGTGNIELRAVDTEAVCAALKSEEWKVVDTRDSNTFIGWCLGGEKKRGHIPGATDYAAEWICFPYFNPWITKEEQAARFEQKLKDKEITPDKNIILYDINGEDAYIVAAFLRNRGFEKMFYYNFSDWTGETMWAPHFENVVPVQWVKDIIDGKKPEFYDGGPYKIFDVSETDEPYEEFVEAHIPGSVHISVNEFQKSPEWCTVSDEELEVFACNNGITVDTTVILYAIGYTGAIHVLASVLQYMGVKHVHCINGSSYQWLYQGYETEEGNPPKQRVESFGARIPQNPQEIVKIEEARLMTEGKTEDQLIDMRLWEQYIGATSGYPYVEKAGRLKNTIWCSDKDYYLNPDETIGNPEEMLKHWESCGVDLKKRAVFFCGAGAW